MPQIRITHGDLLFTGRFLRPTFGLFSETQRLFQAVAETLQPYGFQPADLKWEQGVGPGDMQLTFPLLGYSIVMRLRVDRIEVQSFDLRRVDTSQTRDATRDLLKLVEGVSGICFDTYSLAVGYHGLLDGTSLTSYLAGYTLVPAAALGVLVGAGTSFYYGPEAGRVSSSVTLDRSAAVPEGLFVRVNGVWNAGTITPDQIGITVVEFLEHAMLQFALEPSW